MARSVDSSGLIVDLKNVANDIRKADNLDDIKNLQGYIN